MALVESLLAAIMRADGDALVMHVGEKPHVVAAAGPVELSSRALTFDALRTMIDQVLPPDSRHTLQELGAVEYQLPASPSTGGQPFTMVAARGGDDIWIEIRRQRPAAAPVATVAAAPAAQVVAGVAAAVAQVPASEVETILSNPLPPAASDPGLMFEPPAPSTTPTPDRMQDSSPAVVLPLTRGAFKPEHNTRPLTSPRLAGLDRLLRLAAARGATALYITAESVPSIRVDGQISLLEGEPPLSASEVESLLLDLAPERSKQALKSGEGTEWLSDVPDVGRVRCMSFRDHRGPGGIFRLIPGRAISAEQLGLSRELLALCAEPGGLILVAGPRASGKSTLISALVDVINRTRSDHVITLESEIKFVQENRSSLVSQREVRGDNDEWLAVARAALRENPDVLVIEQLRSAEIVSLALDAAEAGRLVIGSISANTATTAIGRMLDLFPADRRAQVQMTIAEVLHGAISQVLLRKTGGGRVAAREVLLNTIAVARLIAEGSLVQLPAALESGRKYGMVPLNDALVAFVQSGAVDAREAYRKAYDRTAFLSLLKKEGIDTSFVERLA